MRVVLFSGSEIEAKTERLLGKSTSGLDKEWNLKKGSALKLRNVFSKS